MYRTTYISSDFFKVFCLGPFEWKKCNDLRSIKIPDSKAMEWSHYMILSYMAHVADRD